MAFNILYATETGAAGKTTGTIELGAAFGKCGRPVSILGLDENAELSKFLGIDVASLEHSMSEVFKPDGHLDNLSIALSEGVVGSSCVSLVPSTQLLISTIENAKRQGYAIKDHLLSDYIEQYHQDKDFTIIDSPPGLSKIKVNCLYAADLVIIPCKLDPKTTEAAISFVGQIKAVKGEAFENYAILLTAVDGRKKKMVRTCKGKLKELYDELAEYMCVI